MDTQLKFSLNPQLIVWVRSVSLLVIQKNTFQNCIYDSLHGTQKKKENPENFCESGNYQEASKIKRQQNEVFRELLHWISLFIWDMVQTLLFSFTDNLSFRASHFRQLVGPLLCTLVRYHFYSETFVNLLILDPTTRQRSCTISFM